MSTEALVDRIEPYIKGWERTGSKSILHLIKEAQDKMFDYDSPLQRFIATDNKGFPPYLTTVSGTYKYEITAANLSDISAITRNVGGVERTVRARKIMSVFVDISTSDYDKRWVGTPYVYYYPNPYSINTDRINVAAIPIDSYEALESTPAWIQFKEDPGSTSAKYFVEFVWEPPRLTSESIPLVVPERYEDALEFYAIGKAQMFANGKLNEFMAQFEVRRREFQLDMSRGAQSDNEETSRIYC